jgi:hypothetical protein
VRARRRGPIEKSPRNLQDLLHRGLATGSGDFLRGADAHDPTSPGDTICLTSPAMFAMHRASVESRRRRAADIAPMHLLLALIDSPGAADTLGLSDIDLPAVRDDARSKLDA